MSDHTPPAVSDAMREAVEYAIARYVFVGCGEDEEGEEFHWVEGVKTAARAVLSGPIASEIARLTGLNGELQGLLATAGICNDRLTVRAEAAEAETARLRAALEKIKRGTAPVFDDGEGREVEMWMDAEEMQEIARTALLSQEQANV